MSDRLFTVQDLARRWGVSPATVLAWAEAGRLPGTIRLGGTPRGRLRLPESALEEIERSWGKQPATAVRTLGLS